MIELIRSSLILFEREGFFFLQEKVTGSLLVEILLAHSLSYAIQHQQHLIERDVDLHVVLECLKKRAGILRSKQSISHRDLQNILKLLFSRQHEQRA